MDNSKFLFFGLLITILVCGILFGRWTKHYPTVTSTVKRDTVISYVTMYDTVTITHPVNKFIQGATITQKVYVHDTITGKIVELPPFVSTDTLRWDSVYVAISDTGNCYGITSRHSQFGGKIKERTITNTITNVVNQPISLFQLNAGIQTAFNKQFRFYDIAPAVQVEVRNRFFAGYSYYLNSGTHNISLYTKIK